MDALTKAKAWAEAEALDWENAAEEHVAKGLAERMEGQYDSTAKVRECCKSARNFRIAAACMRESELRRAMDRAKDDPESHLVEWDYIGACKALDALLAEGGSDE